MLLKASHTTDKFQAPSVPYSWHFQTARKPPLTLLPLHIAGRESEIVPLDRVGFPVL
jgi:hypothetical protein